VPNFQIGLQTSTADKIISHVSLELRPESEASTERNCMKPIVTSRLPLVKLAAVAATCLAVQSARATQLFTDGFNYAPGGLNASDVSPAGLSGNAWSAGSSHITVVSGGMSYTGLQDLGGNSIQDVWGVSAGSVVNTYASQTSGSVYYSFLLDCQIAPSASTYLTALNPGTGAPNGSSDALQVDVAPGGTGYKIGLRTAGASITLDSPILSLNATYLVVAEYTFGGLGSASLFLNPIAGGTQPTADVTLAGNGTVVSLADVGFKAQTTPTTGQFLIDNIFIGSTWGDVTPLAVASPEPSTLALAGLGLLLAAKFRRARR
jgi:PEP-CTERM motif